MVYTTIGKSGLALAFAGSMTLPDVCAIGTGSGTAAVSDTALESLKTSNPFTTRDISTTRKVTFTTDFGATAMSGTQLAEFGIMVSGADLFNRESFTPIEFDGTNELQVQISFEVY